MEMNKLMSIKPLYILNILLICLFYDKQKHVGQSTSGFLYVVR